MKRIHILQLTIVAALMPMAVSVANAYTGTVELNAYPGVYPGNGGGEFTADTSVNYTGNYASEATYDGGFETFCIEVGVEFYPYNEYGTTYNYGIGQISQPLSNGGEGSATPLSMGAAWLYYEFAEGYLNGFNYTYSSANGVGTRQYDDNLLQAAIWAFQGGQTYGSYPSLTSTETSNPYYLAALAALGGTTDADAASDGAYDVSILQLTDSSGNAAQNQLVMTGTGPTPVPVVPDGGMTLALLGGSLIGLQTLRRKLSL